MIISTYQTSCLHVCGNISNFTLKTQLELPTSTTSDFFGDLLEGFHVYKGPYPLNAHVHSILSCVSIPFSKLLKIHPGEKNKLSMFHYVVVEPPLWQTDIVLNFVLKNQETSLKQPPLLQI